MTRGVPHLALGMANGIGGDSVGVERERPRRHSRWLVVYAAGIALLLVGRFALGRNEEGGVLFYYVAPVALIGGALVVCAGIALLERQWRPVAAAAVAALAAAFAASPGTTDGEHSFAFIGAGALLLIYALASAIGVLRDGSADPRSRKLAVVVIVLAVLGILSALAVAALVLLFILLYEGE